MCSRADLYDLEKKQYHLATAGKVTRFLGRPAYTLDATAPFPVHSVRVVLGQGVLATSPLEGLRCFKMANDYVGGHVYCKVKAVYSAVCRQNANYTAICQHSLSYKLENNNRLQILTLCVYVLACATVC
jgi:hypothetical protein